MCRGAADVCLVSILHFADNIIKAFVGSDRKPLFATVTRTALELSFETKLIRRIPDAVFRSSFRVPFPVI